MVTPKVRYDGIPQYLKERGRFCAWRYEERTNKDGTKQRTKVPYNPKTGYGADSTNPETFADFETARKFAESGNYDGIGVGVFDGLSGIDIDHCIDENGVLTDMAIEIMAAMETYTEISPSGTGLRLFFLAPGYSYDKSAYYINSRKAGEKAGYGGEGLEIYVSGMTNKYMTVTGNAIAPLGIERRADRLQPVLDKFMKRGKKDGDTGEEKPKNTAPATPNDLTDNELLGKAFNAKNGFLISELWNGDCSRYDSRSEADLALCNILAFWTGRDAQRIDRLFRQSDLMRDKWDEQRGNSTYGADTIRTAIEGCWEVFTPSKNDKSSQDENGAETTENENSSQDEKSQDDTAELQDPAEIAAKIYACEGYEEPTATGLIQLDMVTNGGLRSGLTVLGATSSAGKTTLCVQLGDNIAANGRPVLFVSIEQSGRELVSKSLSRMMAQRGYKSVPAWAMNSPKERERWTEGKAAALVEACNEYSSKIAPNLFYLSSSTQPTVAQVETQAKIVQGKRGVSPVVIIDYLQLLAPKDERDTDKRAADYNVSQLRRMARDMKAPVIAISSLNRTSYSGSIEMESYKESGGIEYAADLLLGLQPYNMEARMDSAKGEDARKKRAKDITKEFKRKTVRECEIVVLKNRNGALPPEPLPVTFDCASSMFYDGTEATEEKPDSGEEWLS